MPPKPSPKAGGAKIAPLSTQPDLTMTCIRTPPQTAIRVKETRDFEAIRRGIARRPAGDGTKEKAVAERKEMRLDIFAAKIIETGFTLAQEIAELRGIPDTNICTHSQMILIRRSVLGEIKKWATVKGYTLQEAMNLCLLNGLDLTPRSSTHARGRDIPGGHAAA